jgi:hypothetical protein
VDELPVETPAERLRIAFELHELATSGAERRRVVEEERDIGAEHGGERVEFSQRRVEVPQFAEPAQSRGRVAAAAAQPAPHGDGFVETDVRAFVDAEGVGHQPRGFHGDVAVVGRHLGHVALERETARARFERDGV